MKRFLIITFLILSFKLANAQTCKLEVGYLYSIFVFSENNTTSLKEIFGEEINPMLVNVIQVKDAAGKKRIDEQCKSTKMGTAIFVYPKKDKTKTKTFCNQEEYLHALKNSVDLVIGD